jgi:perosamine synthetase
MPVLVDSDPQTWCMDVAQVEQKLTERTRAIMPVHIYGHPVDLDPLLALTAERQIAVVEDAAEAHGAEYLAGRNTESPRWGHCGSFGDMSCFSFYANKVVTTGEGGMVLTDSDEIARRLRLFRNLGFRPERRFFHETIGFNFRLTNLQAAIGLAQVEQVDRLVTRKREIGQRYTRRLRKLAGLELQIEQPWARSVFWMYGVVVREETGLDASTLASLLAQRAVETRPFFLGMHEQPVFLARGLFSGGSHPVAERLARQGLYLPSGTALTDEQVERVCDALAEVLS